MTAFRRKFAHPRWNFGPYPSNSLWINATSPALAGMADSHPSSRSRPPFPEISFRAGLQRRGDDFIDTALRNSSPKLPLSGCEIWPQERSGATGRSSRTGGQGLAHSPATTSLGRSPTSLALGQLQYQPPLGVLQADKLRACDDLMRSLTNLVCSVSTPIHRVSWDRLSQLPNLISRMG